jgi:glycosyltransferase involved in cell wall biosynthesis
VQFLGQVADIGEWYGKADLLLLTSDHEGTPNVVLEAMASALPVVSTGVGDVPDLLGGGERGCLAASGDVAGLVSATEDLLRDESKRSSLAQRARDYVEREHSHATLQCHLANLYTLCLA